MLSERAVSLSLSLLSRARPYLAFRQPFRNPYLFDLESERAAELRRGARTSFRAVADDLGELSRVLQALADELEES